MLHCLPVPSLFLFLFFTTAFLKNINFLGFSFIYFSTFLSRNHVLSPFFNSNSSLIVGDKGKGRKFLFFFLNGWNFFVDFEWLFVTWLKHKINLSKLSSQTMDPNQTLPSLKISSEFSPYSSQIIQPQFCIDSFVG